MKLRNKKTGAIYSIEDIDLGNNKDGIWLGMTRYKSLAELNEEWEDLEEDKRYWYIDADSEVMSKEMAWFTQEQDNIGNRFETREEAEKAVEKLKAWKRLKDNGLKINRWLHTPDMKLTTGSFIKIEGYIPAVMKNMEDLDLLFSGGEK